MDLYTSLSSIEIPYFSQFENTAEIRKRLASENIP